MRKSIDTRLAARAALAALPLLLVPQSALAYIDPNTGGMIFQMLAPLLAMVTSAWLFARDYIKSMWRRLWGRVLGPAEPAALPVDPHSQR